MTVTSAELDQLPHVSISIFKSNPAHYLTTGAAVTTHGRVSAAFIPVLPSEAAEREPAAALETAKAQLRLLARLTEADVAADELRRLSAARDDETVGDAR